MNTLLLLSLGLSGSSEPPADRSLLAAVPDEAFALVHVSDPGALRSRAERNDWINLCGTRDGAHALESLEREYEGATKTDFDGLLEVISELRGEALLFSRVDATGFLTEPPADRDALAKVLSGWLEGGSQVTQQVGEASVQVGAWPQAPGKVLAFVDHPLALGLFSGKQPEDVLSMLTDSLSGLTLGKRSPLVEGYLAAGGGRSNGVEAFVDFTPWVAEAEEELRKAVDGVLPDPTGLLGLEKGTSLFVSADVFPGTQIQVRARLSIPPDTLAARLADTFVALPPTLPADLPRGTWSVWALHWNLGAFYDTLRGAFDQEEEGLATVDQGLAAAEAVSGIDPVEDVLKQLSGLFALYNVLDDQGELAENVEEGFALLAGLVDGDRFFDAVEALMYMGGGEADAIELEGSETFLLGDSDSTGDFGGLSILPHRMLVSMSRDTLVRGLRALGRAEGAGLEWGSGLQGALDQNGGACALVYAELEHLRALVLRAQGEPELGERDPFESTLVFAARRTPKGFDLQLRTR